MYIDELNVKDGELVRISSRRGSVITRVFATDRVRKGDTYITYQWWIGTCNEITVDNLDIISKTYEYKYCVVKVERIRDHE